MPPKKPSGPSFAQRLLNARKNLFRDRLLPTTHFLERHYIHPKLEWTAAAQLLAATFPKDTRQERPKPWYNLLAGTHWPMRQGAQQVPPGNGPFYVPEWVFNDLSEAEQKAMGEALKKAGFREVAAHVGFLPENAEYLATAMRIAGPYRWTVNPLTYRVYVYPSLGKAKKDSLRPYTTSRWRL